MTGKPVIRLSRMDDLNSIKDIDLKSYVYSLTTAQWQELLKASKNDEQARVIMAEYELDVVSPHGYRTRSNPAGFAVWQKHDGDYLLLRLGVVPEFKRRGVGSLLFSTIVTDARKKGIDTIWATIPDCHALPGDPDDASAWLLKMGFRATGKIIEEYKFMYGRMREGIEFRYHVL